MRFSSQMIFCKKQHILKENVGAFLNFPEVTIVISGCGDWQELSVSSLKHSRTRPHVPHDKPKVLKQCIFSYIVTPLQI